MVETEVLSPDSGLGEVSPSISVSLESDFDERSAGEKEEFILSPLRKMYTEASSHFGFSQDRNASLFTKFGSFKKPCWNSDEKISSRPAVNCQKNTNILDVKSKKGIKRRRKGGKKSMLEADDSSPVLGIRILPAKLFRDSHDEDFIETNCLHNKSQDKRFVCRLCFQPHEDALALAAHKCARIINERYTCPDCDKSFGCPANLASHRRWHKPKEIPVKPMENRKTEIDDNSNMAGTSGVLEKEKNEPFTDLKKFESEKELSSKERAKSSEEVRSIRQNFQKAIYPCPYCKRRFRRNSNRRKHVQVKHGITIPPSQTEEKTTSKKIVSKRRGSNVTESRQMAPKVVQPSHSMNTGLMHFQNTNVRSRSVETAFTSRSPLSSSLSWPQCSKTSVYHTSTSFARSAQDFTFDPDSEQPLDLSMKKTREEKLHHGIEEIMRAETNIFLRRPVFPFQPMLQFPPPPLIPHISPSQLASCSTATVRPSTCVQEALTGVFCSPNPFLSYTVHRTLAPSRPNVSHYFSEKRA